jgi:hypothetical protein
MKTLAIASFALAANIAVGATSIVVNGYGTDRETAKRDAFRTAIEKVCGSAVLSDRENVNSKNVHNKILVYSSCRVQNYTILEDNGTDLKVKVYLTDNKSSQRIHSSSNNRHTFDYGQVKEQMYTWREEQKLGDELVDEIFRDYPYFAYNLNQTTKPYITTDSYRHTYLMVPYDLRWNDNFIVALNETFKALSNSKGNGAITMVSRHNGNFLTNKDYFYIDDLSRLDRIKSKFNSNNDMRLKVNARDFSGKNILSVCYSPEYKAGGIFYSIGIDDELTIFGNDRNRGTMKINLTFPADVIYDVSVDVVAVRDCKL